MANFISNRTALYLRVSTVDQKVDLQLDQLKAYAERAHLQVIDTYVDVAISGKKEGRPQLNALMKAARHYHFDCVLVWKFDRFARSVSHLLKALEEFNHLNIRFVSLQDHVDTDSPMGKAMFAIIGAMAELESSLISERVKAGMASAKARGKSIGRPKTPPFVINQIEQLAQTTDPSINQIKDQISKKVSGIPPSRATIGEIVRRVRKAGSSD